MSIRTTLAVAALLAVPAMEASAATYTYVGSWNVATGDYSDPSNPLLWTNNPAVFTGQEAAAYLFGGDAADYVISTVSDLVADINFSAWLDGWGDGNTYGPGGTPAAQDFSYDSTGLGYNGCNIAGTGCYQSAYSALVIDHLVGADAINYAFRVAEVPLPAGGLLLIGAIGGLGFAARRRSA